MAWTMKGCLPAASKAKIWADGASMLALDAP
jgi:hypothetical protein